MKLMKRLGLMVLVVSLLLSGFAPKLIAEEDPNKNILKQGLLGAGTGAIAASASGGKAGKGALIGAGTNVIGGALLDSLMGGGSQPKQQQVVYTQAPPQYASQAQYSQQQQYTQQQGGYYYEQPQPMYAQQVYQTVPPQEDPNKKILKSGLLGAATGGIAASASGGKAGKGALIGAGTNVIGGALLDTLTAPSQPKQQVVYAQQPPPAQYQQYPPQQQYQQGQYYQPQTSQANISQTPQKKIIRKFNSDGKVVSEEEVWQ